ncbi:hypothetical protein IN07_12130 [Modestobacter caceresii]|uniref:Phage holin family protein n=1 Tax=Modestobacter caceresii TaxID=1522368 RepID=A0A098Y7H2_9ACTN|nr:hypothetical protein IN07_12130 [Modestobacter caceresii]
MLAAIIFAVTRLVEGIEVIGNPTGFFGETGTYLWVALLFALVNSIIGPIVRLLALPFVILTLGLFLLVINAAMLGLTAALSDRFTVDGFLAALFGGFLIALFSWIAELVLPLKVRGH